MVIIPYTDFTRFVEIMVASDLRKKDILRDFIPFSDYIDMARSVIKKAESSVIL